MASNSRQTSTLQKGSLFPRSFEDRYMYFKDILPNIEPNFLMTELGRVSDDEMFGEFLDKLVKGLYPRVQRKPDPFEFATDVCPIDDSEYDADFEDDDDDDENCANQNELTNVIDQKLLNANKNNLVETGSEKVEGFSSVKIKEHVSSFFLKKEELPLHSSSSAVKEFSTSEQRHNCADTNSANTTEGYGGCANVLLDSKFLEKWIVDRCSLLNDRLEDAIFEYFCEKCSRLSFEDKDLKRYVEEIVQRNYSGLEDHIKRKHLQESRNSFFEEITADELLQIIPNPKRFFMETSATMSELYRRNAYDQLLSQFPNMPPHIIKMVLQNHNSHYLPTFMALQDFKPCMTRYKALDAITAQEMDNIFMTELCYVRLKEEVDEKLRQKSKNRHEFREALVNENSLVMCSVCCSNVSPTNMRSCSLSSVAHNFCIPCLSTYCKDLICRSKMSLKCLEPGCLGVYSVELLQTLVKPSEFNSFLKKKQIQELSDAHFQDVEFCPFCQSVSFITSDSKVLYCTNPSCLKESCRLCKKPAHLPLRCDDLETPSETLARTALERKKSEAVVRECLNCGMRFIKDGGCNMMICPCGETMCYLCKKRKIGHFHFGSMMSASNTCPIVDDDEDWTKSAEITKKSISQAVAETMAALGRNVSRAVESPNRDLNMTQEIVFYPNGLVNYENAKETFDYHPVEQGEMWFPWMSFGRNDEQEPHSSTGAIPKKK